MFHHFQPTIVWETHPDTVGLSNGITLSILPEGRVLSRGQKGRLEIVNEARQAWLIAFDDELLLPRHLFLVLIHDMRCRNTTAAGCVEVI